MKSSKALAVLCAFVVVLIWACGSDGSSAPAPALRPSELVYERVVNGNQDLYVLPARGGLERRLTDHPAVDGLPRWSRDGRSVIFTSNRSGNWQLWTVPAQGGECRRLRMNGATEWQADLSPDSRRLAFLSNIDGAESLWLWSQPAGGERRLVRHGDKSILGNPHWSPDGSRIVFSSNSGFTGHGIYLVDVTTGQQTRISPLTSGGCEPRFSPDGHRVVYVRRRHLTRERSWIVEYDVRTGEERILVDWPALNYDPVYSPDGSEIAFASTVAGEYAIYRKRVSSGQAWRVSFGVGPARYPDYRPLP